MRGLIADPPADKPPSDEFYKDVKSCDIKDPRLKQGVSLGALAGRFRCPSGSSAVGGSGLLGGHAGPVVGHACGEQACPQHGRDDAHQGQ